MLNFFPSPIECLIYRANNNSNKLNDIHLQNEGFEEKNESSRKIINDIQNDNTIILNNPSKELQKYNEIEKKDDNCNSSRRENEGFNDKKDLELQNIKNV
jgi:hypothetical protein